MYRILVFLLLAPLTGCNVLRAIAPQYEKDRPASGTPTLPNDYTLTGTTTQNFQLIAPVRVADSVLVVRVKRAGEEWETLDKFEVFTSSKGVGGGSVRFWYRNLVVGGVARPVAPTGSEYSIRSVSTIVDKNLYQ